jgi:hypothetical protein
MDTDLPDWLERLESKKELKTYIRKEPKRSTKKKSKPAALHARPGQLSLSLMDIVADAAPSSSRTLRNSGQPKATSSKHKKHRASSHHAAGGLKPSTSREKVSSATREATAQSLKRLADSFEAPETPFGAPVWKKRRAQIQLGVEELLEYCQKAVTVCILFCCIRGVFFRYFLSRMPYIAN